MRPGRATELTGPVSSVWPSCRAARCVRVRVLQVKRPGQCGGTRRLSRRAVLRSSGERHAYDIDPNVCVCAGGVSWFLCRFTAGYSTTRIRCAGRHRCRPVCVRPVDYSVTSHRSIHRNQRNRTTSSTTEKVKYAYALAGRFLARVLGASTATRRLPRRAKRRSRTFIARRRQCCATPALRPSSVALTLGGSLRTRCNLRTSHRDKHR